jgi:hypothetical protein
MSPAEVTSQPTATTESPSPSLFPTGTPPSFNEAAYLAELYYAKANFDYAVAAKETGVYKQIDLENAEADEALAKQYEAEAEE